MKHNITKISSNIFYKIQDKEFSRVFTSWIKKGGMYLLGGAPGIGKSTLILQIVKEMLKNNQVNVAYFTWEEQESQIFSRRNRLWWNSKNLEDSSSKNTCPMSIFHTTHLESIISTSKDAGFDFIVIDSIQTIYSVHSDSTAGSPNQVKYCAEKLSEFSKKYDCTIFIIGHITKGWEIAGPKYLEHIVDVVMYLEWDRFGQLRFLRSQKNRFGHTDDSGIFDMTPHWFKPVYDLKERILQNANIWVPGSVLTIWLDNGRPVITTIEVLLNKTNFKFPTRNCIGVSAKRVDMITAILERYLKVNLSLFDIFVNVPGEFSFLDSGLDLAIAVWILSQHKNIKVPWDTIFVGELGLSWQIVKTKLHDKRLREIPDWFQKIDHEVFKNIIKIKDIF